jgi:large subunit ribosomal protein L1
LNHKKLIRQWHSFLKKKSGKHEVDTNKTYSLKDASSLVKDITTCKFDASVDLHIRLGVDPKKADQAIRGTVTLPHGTGKTKKYWCFAVLTRKLQQKALVLIMWVLMSLYKRSKAAGLM